MKILRNWESTIDEMPFPMGRFDKDVGSLAAGPQWNWWVLEEVIVVKYSRYLSSKSSLCRKVSYKNDLCSATHTVLRLTNEIVINIYVFCKCVIYTSLIYAWFIPSYRWYQQVLSSVNGEYYRGHGIPKIVLEFGRPAVILGVRAPGYTGSSARLSKSTRKFWRKKN